MRTSVLFDFSVDRENKTIKVEREFVAPLDRVWAAWTRKELLDQWWAPKPYRTETKKLDFREGGHWLYAMVGPEGNKIWCRADYKLVNPMKSFSGLDAFCDENGKVTEAFPNSLWTTHFSRRDDSTLVSIEIKYKEISDLEKIIEMGFREGFTAALENLDALLAL